MENKKANMSLMHEIIIHVVMIALIFGLFFIAGIGSVDSRDVKQQVLEKQLALAIESAIPGTIIEIDKKTSRGEINKIDIRNGRIYVMIDDFASVDGYMFFSRHDVFVEDDKNKFYIHIE